ncbi:hypothetical protein HD554DRAFT_1998825, partial [Boletus coccyginus]
ACGVIVNLIKLCKFFECVLLLIGVSRTGKMVLVLAVSHNLPGIRLPFCPMVRSEAYS